MITCLAIDDEPLALRQLVTYISKVPYLQLAGQCRSAAEARTILEEEAIDAIFIDINMPDMGGLDFVRSLAAPPLVVFTTAYSEYALDGFKVDAVDYLLKPFGLDDFRHAADKVKERHDLQVAALASDTATPMPADTADSLFLRCDYKTVCVKVADILYIKSMSEYLRIYLVDKPKPLTVLLAMKRIEERLPKSIFLRVHRSYIVNLRHIREVDKSRVVMDDGAAIAVGGLYKDAFDSYVESRRLENRRRPTDSEADDEGSVMF